MSALGNVAKAAGWGTAAVVGGAGFLALGYVLKGPSPEQRAAYAQAAAHNAEYNANVRAAQRAVPVIERQFQPVHTK